jgi:uncharacterized membrane protein YbhN (UPF0104 family)
LLTSLLFSILFWVGALFVAAVMINPEWYETLSSREVVYLAGAGVVSLFFAIYLSMRVRQIRLDSSKRNTEQG